MRTSKIQQRKTIRLLQITDCHLFSETDKTLLGVNTYVSFRTVLAEIENKGTVFDYVILTGDLSQDQSIASYQHVAKALSHWHQPAFWLPGNHDNLQNMQQALNTFPLQHTEYVLLGNDWQMIILDSHVPGKPHGYLAEDQFRLIEKIVAFEPTRFTLILLHHHPLFSSSQWLDQHCLHNKDAFWQKLHAFSQIKGVVCGHIHQDLDLEYQGCRVMAAPSSCIQFLKNSNEFALDEIPPGWREIILHSDGTIETVVGRVEQNKFKPDKTSSGY